MLSIESRLHAYARMSKRKKRQVIISIPAGMSEWSVVVSSSPRVLISGAERVPPSGEQIARVPVLPCTCSLNAKAEIAK